MELSVKITFYEHTHSHPSILNREARATVVMAQIMLLATYHAPPPAGVGGLFRVRDQWHYRAGDKEQTRPEKRRGSKDA